MLRQEAVFWTSKISNLSVSEQFFMSEELKIHNCTRGPVAFISIHFGYVEMRAKSAMAIGTDKYWDEDSGEWRGDTDQWMGDVNENGRR